MRSFDVAVEPQPGARLAAVALLWHGVAAASPWIAHVASPAALVLSSLAAAGLAATLARIPGRHCRLAAVVFDARGCRARLAGERCLVPAQVRPSSRVTPWILLLDLRAGGRRCGWLLARGSLPPAELRRLRARIRLSC